MLDILRKKASSWIIKALLGLVAVVFIFFFGSSTLRGPQQGGEVVAEVLGESITEATLSGLIRLEQDSNSLYQDLPEEMQGQLRVVTLNSLIQSLVIVHEAHKLGLRVAKEELAALIKQDPRMTPEGKFDLKFYQEQFRPGHQFRYGIDYEDWLARQILGEKLRSAFFKLIIPSDRLIKNSTYDLGLTVRLKRVTFSSVPSEPPDPAGHVDELWRQFVSGEPFKINDTTIKFEEEELPPTSLSNGSSLFSGNFDADAIAALFRLTPDQPFPKAPIVVGGKIYFFRLIDKQETKREDAVQVSDLEKEEFMGQLANGLMNRWYAEKASEAHIVIK